MPERAGGLTMTKKGALQYFKNEILRKWRESAAFWRDHYPRIRTMLAPVTKALIEEARITEGDRVLDVAGGSGEPSLTIAELVGPRGLVTCKDTVAEIVLGPNE